MQLENMSLDIINGIKSIWYTMLLYVNAMFTLMTPGTVIWKLFKTKKGKISLISRDLILDSETLINLPKCEKPLDQFTNALCPFAPLFLLDNDNCWKQRRDAFSYGNIKINERILSKSLDIKFSSKQGNILWDVFQIISKFSFELIFDRSPTIEEFNDIYPGLIDINKIIKRFSSNPNMKIRQIFYDRILLLINQNETNFLFNNHKGFHQMNELHQVSSVAEDFLITIAVQCTDLVCHMLLLYSEHPDAYHDDVDNFLNETLRLYPLTDLWVRQPDGKERGWIASLVQLNRNGWSQPNTFIPSRWNSKEHPPLMSWGFDVRRCPAQKLATYLSKLVFENLIHHDDFWIQPASNFDHERTFPYGCQVWIGYGQKPDEASTWKFNNKFKMQFRRWLFEKLRMIDQNELN